MTPEKNGVLVYCPEYDSWAMTDVYRLGKWGFIFVLSKPFYDPTPHGTPQAIVTLGDGFRKTTCGGYKVWVVPSSNVTVLEDWR